MLIRTNLSALIPDPEILDARLRARITRWELFALLLALCLLGVFSWVHAELDILPFDYSVYLNTAQGELQHYYYADWILPLFGAFSLLPYSFGYLLWGAILTLGMFFAARVFGGNVPLVLLSYQMLYVLFFGQIVALLVGGLALLWWGMAHRRWHLAGLGLLLAVTKFQIGLTFGLFLWLLADIPWRHRLRVLILPAGIAILSLLFNPAWPLELLERLQAVPPNDWGSIAPWRWIGPAALVFWLPPALLPFSRSERLLALTAATPLALPYFQQTDLLALFVLPVGWLPVLLGNLGYLFFQYRFSALQILVVIPLLIYAALVFPALHRLLRSRHSPLLI